MKNLAEIFIWELVENKLALSKNAKFTTCLFFFCSQRLQISQPPLAVKIVTAKSCLLHLTHYLQRKHTKNTVLKPFRYYIPLARLKWIISRTMYSNLEVIMQINNAIFPRLTIWTNFSSYASEIIKRLFMPINFLLKLPFLWKFSWFCDRIWKIHFEPKKLGKNLQFQPIFGQILLAKNWLK